MKLALAASCLALGIATPCALAATPAEGTVTIYNTELSFTNGPIVGVNPTPFIADQTGLICRYDIDCDRFDLTIDLPENLTEVFPSPVLKVQLTWDSPLGTPVDDYDLYVYNEDGNQIAFSADLNTGANALEAVTIPVGSGTTAIYMDIMYFLATGSTFTGNIRLDLGLESDDADLEAFYAENPPPGEGLFIPEEASSEDVAAEPRSANTRAGGSLGLLTLLLAGIAGVRRAQSFALHKA